MKTTDKIHSRAKWMMTLLLSTLVVSCNNHSHNGDTSTETAPQVISTNIEDQAVDVPINTKLSATFNQAMDPTSLNELSFKVAAGETAVDGLVSYDNASNIALFTPATDFSSATLYTATISSLVKNALGTPLASDFVWSFTTAAALDISSPTVSSTFPVDFAINFALNRNISAEMSEALDPATATTNNFTLTNGTELIAGTVHYTDTTITFDPDSDLVATTLYTATLTTGITDLAIPANPLAVNFVWSFTTGTDVAAGPDMVNLRTAGNMVILSKTGITNVPISSITGNIGSSPITAAAMDNVTCSEMSGTIYGSDAAYTGSGDTSCFAGTASDTTLVANAVLDMGTAYDDAAGRTLPDFTELYAGDLSGQTLVPGLYKWSSNILVSTDMTLEGGANDVWIFQIAGDVYLAEASSIILAGGAQAKNVFWQVGGGTGAVIGTTAHFEGIILAEKAITVNTGASVYGRLLAQTAVTIDQNAITQPAE